MGRVAEADGESPGLFQILEGLVPMAQAELHQVGIVETAPGGVHGVGLSVFVIGADDEDGERIKPGFGAKILAHTAAPF